MEFNTRNKAFLSSLLAHVFLLNIYYIHSGYSMSSALYDEMERCCKFHLKSPAFNTSNCFQKIENVLTRQKITYTRSYKYTKKIWRSMSIVTKEYETVNQRKLEDNGKLAKNDTSFHYWSVNASQPVSASLHSLVFERHPALILPGPDDKDSPTSAATVTRLELLIPFYYVHPDRGCQKGADNQMNVTVTYNGKTYSSKEGTVPHRNMLVFLLSHTPTKDKHNGKIVITLNTNQDFMFIHPKGSMLLEFFNIDEDVIAKMRHHAMKRAKAKAASKQDANSVGIQGQDQSSKTNRENTKSAKRRQSSKLKRSARKAAKIQNDSPVNTQLCRAYRYTVDAQDHLNIRGIIYHPRKINVGMCSGKCNALTLELADAYQTGRSVLLNHLVKSPDGRDPLRPRCVPRYMRSVTLFINTRKGVGVYNLHSASVVSCRCG